MIYAHWELSAQVATAVMGAVSAGFAFFAKKHAKHAKETGIVVEDAVNHRHNYADTQPRLYDIALENRRQLAANEFDHANLFEAIDRLEQVVEHHVQWEEREKYAELQQRLDKLTGDED